MVPVMLLPKLICCTFTSALSEVCVQCPIWLFFVLPWFCAFPMCCSGIFWMKLRWFQLLLLLLVWIFFTFLPHVPCFYCKVIIAIIIIIIIGWLINQSIKKHVLLLQSNITCKEIEQVFLECPLCWKCQIQDMVLLNTLLLKHLSFYRISQQLA